MTALAWYLLIGYWRLCWGVCPRCNSDAPAIDTCRVCDNWRPRLYLYADPAKPPDVEEFPPSLSTRVDWFVVYLMAFRENL